MYIYIHVQYCVYHIVYKVFIVVVKKLYIQLYLFVRIPSAPTNQKTAPVRRPIGLALAPPPNDKIRKFTTWNLKSTTFEKGNHLAKKKNNSNFCLFIVSVFFRKKEKKT